ncbi:MAG TPA: hypothetical protein VMN39_13055 [Longimicrobiaceae bacterium]|nr:hypothetical protein [Longimicrobiaceae bacterium]
MSREQKIGLLVAALVVVFLLGFLPQWTRVRNLEGELRQAHVEIVTLDLQGRLGAALAESQRGNYEQARQLMTEFFSVLQIRAGEIGGPARQQEIQAILAERDELITLLSRAQPEASSRLNLMYSRYFAAMGTASSDATRSVTPATPP